MSLDVYLKDPTATYGEHYLYEANITHNLGKMAVMAGIYEALWRPEEIGKTKAGELIDLIELGLSDMKAKPDYYKQFDAENGWGTYNDFVPWIECYLQACKDFAEAIVRVSR